MSPKVPIELPAQDHALLQNVHANYKALEDPTHRGSGEHRYLRDDNNGVDNKEQFTSPCRFKSTSTQNIKTSAGTRDAFVAPTQRAAAKPFISTAVADVVTPVDPPAGPSKLSTASMIGGITGGAAFILILLISVVLWLRRRQKRYLSEAHEQQTAHPFMDWRSPTTHESKSGILGGQQVSTVWQQYGSSEVSRGAPETLTISWRPGISASPNPVEENPRGNVPPYSRSSMT